MVKVCIEGAKPEVEAFLQGLQKKYLYLVNERTECEEGIRIFFDAKRIEHRWIHIQTGNGQTVKIPCWDLEVSRENEKSRWRFQSYDIFT
ncbi:MAG: hypothetical protein WB502_15600 [Thermoactinomyces sp.]